MTNLNIDQQFKIAAFKQQVSQMSEAQAKEFLVKLHEQMVVREVTYQELLKHQWGIGTQDGIG
jgi:hypothetical protein